MLTKETIAIVGATETFGPDLAQHFANVDYPLLLISDKREELSSLHTSLSRRYPLAEIDFLECVKGGCWEADIILLAVPEDQQVTATGLMKDVAVQKIVVTLFGSPQQMKNLKEVLPFSRLAGIHIDADNNKVEIFGDLPQTENELVTLFNTAGFATEITKSSLQTNHFLTQKK